MRPVRKNKVLPLAVFVEDLYQVLEVWYPILRLKEENIPTINIGSGAKDFFASKEGYPCKADISIAAANPDDFSGVLIPGGFAPDFMRRNLKFAEFVKKLNDQGKPVAAICHGGWMLVSAGILKGRRATSFFAIKDDLIAAGADWVDEEVVVDRNLITSRKPEDLPAFTREIIKKLGTGKCRDAINRVST